MSVTLTRRELLSGIAAWALVRPAIAQVIPSGDASTFDAFSGNPYVAITAIDASGGIIASRISGQTPAFIHVSASAIKATGTSTPFEDLEFAWDFGEKSGTEYFTNPVTGATVNANSDQRGPEAAYVYRSAGSYRITLTIRGKNDSSYVTATTTKTIKVSAYSASGGDWYFDSNAPTGGDGSVGKPFNRISDINAKAAMPYAALHLKRGSKWVVTSATPGIGKDFLGQGAIFLGVSPFRMDAYGSGKNPIIEVLNNDPQNILPACRMHSGGSQSPAPKNDIVISNIDFVRSGTFAANLIQFVYSSTSPAATASNIYLDKCNCVSRVKAASYAMWIRMQYSAVATAGKTTNFGVWGGSSVADGGDQSTGIGFFCGAQNWHFIVGWTVNGAGGDSVYDHHIYPNVQNHALFRWINFGAGPNRNYCINTNFDSLDGTQQVAQYYLVTGCNFSGALRGHDASNGHNDPSTVTFTNFVIEFNTFHGLNGDGVILFFCATTMTWRYNKAWSCNGGRFFTPGYTLASLFRGKFYNNNIFRNGGSAKGGIIDYESRSGAIRWTVPQIIRNNIIYDAQNPAICVAVNVADQVAAGSTIDHNQYYAPNDGDQKFLLNNSTPIAFGKTGIAGTWQNAGLDVNGSVANPNWSDPENGKF